MNGTPECPYDLPEATEATSLSPLIEKSEVALLMLVGFAGFSLLVGLGYNALRRYVFRDIKSLDVIFDAGGRVSISLTAVTVTSQTLWPADFLQSPTNASKVGVGGTLWYSLAVILSIMIFPVMCIQLKTRAPGAKTFPQIVLARFGKVAHIVFCVVALFTNLVVIANLVLAGKATVDVLGKDSSSEFIILIMAVLFGSYCIIGGLGTTFYISYFNTALIFTISSYIILKFTYLSTPEVEEITSTKSIFKAMDCLRAPDGNYNNSFLSFRTESGVIKGVVTLFVTVASLFCDQALWQSRIAAKPREGIIGFFIAAFLWYGIPTPVSFVNSMSYLYLSYRNGTNLLTPDQIDEGFITPFIIQTLLGREGCFLLLTLVSMTLMSTGSGEVMSISSILVYDIVKTYIKPFRKHLQPTDCPLCSKSKLPLSDSPDVVCNCLSVIDCDACKADKLTDMSGKFEFEIQYQCKHHGMYRHYEHQLIKYKSWCMVCIAIAIVPYGLVIVESGMNLNWAFMAAQIFIAPFLVPLYMSIAWAGATAGGVVIGSIVGLVAAVGGMCAYATRHEGGLSDFYTNTAEDWSVLTGLIAATVVSTVVAIAVSLHTRRCHGNKSRSRSYPMTTVGNPSCAEPKITAEKTGVPEEQDNIEWLKTMSIDNPLNPYRALYRRELQTINAGQVLTSKHMEKIFRKIRLVTYTATAVSFLVFLVVIPIAALSVDVVSEGQLGMWISICQHWCLVATVLVVLVPPIQEGIQVYRQYKKNKAEKQRGF